MNIKTYQGLYQWLCHALSFRENAANESRWLIEYTTKKSFFEVKEAPCFGEDFSFYEKAINALKEEIPFQYILGEQDFYGLTFFVDRRVLVPRPETEVLVDAAVAWGKGKKMTTLDVCTGSGCIAVAMAKHLTGDFYATDISSDALDVAKANSLKNDVLVTFFCSDLFAEVPESLSFDIITANPPYLTKEDMNAIPKELEYEPSNALFGGNDGLTFCKTLIEEVPQRLNPGGLFLMEIGEEQGPAVFAMAETLFSETKICKDLNRKDRFLYAFKKT